MDDTHVVSIVDDDASVREALESLFRSVGLPVVSFPSAEAFLAAGQARTTTCLILDLRMPGLDGLGLQQRLIRAGHTIPIVILTGHGDDDARVRAVGAGAVAFMVKPFDGEFLVRVVEAALGTHA
jgi:FixJ family two-component response regulator